MSTKKIKIALMCGHGTQTNGVWDAGCSYAGYTEAKLMLPITKAAVKYLRSYGVEVITDSDSNNNRNMIKSVAWANKEKDVQIYISCHCDYKAAPSGVYPLYVSASGKKLATALNNAVKSGMDMKSRGICRRTDLYELNATSMPACILETGAIKADLAVLRDKSDKYGKCIAKGVMDYLGKEIPAEKEPAKKTEVLYRVRKSWSDSKSQIGAYKSLDNAKKECDKHPGYSVYGENGKLIYTKKAAETQKKTKAGSLVAFAKKYCWAYGTPEKKWSYKTGNPTTAYKTGLKKYMGRSARISLSDCGYFVSTCVRAAGLSSTFNCLNWSAKIPSTMKVVLKGKKIPSGTLKPGDIIRYKKTSGSQHTLMYIGDGKIAEAGRKIRFPIIRKDTGKYNASNVKHTTLQVLRAK